MRRGRFKPEINDMWLHQGRWPYMTPFGYNRHPKKDFVPHPIESKIIKEIYNLYSTDKYTAEMLVDHIAQKYEMLFKWKYIYKILEQPFYHGIMVSKGKEYPHIYEKLISKELFDYCKNISKNHITGKYKFLKRMIFKNANTIESSDPLVSFLSTGKSIEEICQFSAKSISEVSQNLSDLELQGFIAEIEPGKWQTL